MTRIPLERRVLAILRTVAALIGGWIGLVVGHGLGEALAYAIAALTDQDIGSLKDMLIWSVLTGAAATGIAGVWLALVLTRASRVARRAALIALAGAVVSGAALMLATFDWPKSAGIPMVDFELRLPADFPPLAEVNYSVTVWSERVGHGCTTREVRMDDGRQVIVGSLVVPTDTETPTMSLLIFSSLPRPINYWPMPIGKDAALEKEFGPWRRIVFLPPRHAEQPPLPAGTYDIRYRVRRYI